MPAPRPQRMVPSEVFRPRRLLVVGAMAIAATLTAAPAAFAHVSVTPDIAEPGKPATIEFRVPNERGDESTVRIEVAFPSDQPFASAVPQSVPGWTVTVHKRTLDQPVQTNHGLAGSTVSSIVWEGGQIPPGTFQDFPVYLGTMPAAAGSLTFKALQTYSGGEVTRWIDVPEAGRPEPEHPAPTVRLSAPAPAAATESTSDGSTSDPTALVLGGGGLAAGLAALGWVALSRRRPAETPPARADRATKRDKVRL
jgi:uncharacterized protein YcnI